MKLSHRVFRGVLVVAMSVPAIARAQVPPGQPVPPAPPAAERLPQPPAQPPAQPQPPAEPPPPASQPPPVMPPTVEPPITGPINDDTGSEGRDHEDDEDGGKHAKHHHDPIEYEPRRGITIRAGKAKLRFFMGIETVLLYGHCSGKSLKDDGEGCEATDLVTTHVRRARFALEAKLPHHLTIDFGIQVKNEIIVLKNANLSWKHDHLTLKAGFLKPPGGMERDSSTWIKAFPERSVVANFKQDRVIGLMATKWVADHTLRVQVAAGRPPTGNFDAFEPEDVVVPPSTVEAEDLTTDPGNWDLFATLAYAPSDNFEIGLNSTAHIAPDAGQGTNFSEPYETKIINPVFFKGVFMAGGADFVWHGPRVRASAEVVAFLTGDTIPHTDELGNPLEPTRGKRGVSGYTVLGFTPNGEYGPALQNAPLLKGYQFLLRGEFLTVSPGGDGLANSTAGFGAGTVGVEWQVHKQLRLQFDTSLQHFNEAVDIKNKDVWRSYTELWAQVLL